MCILASLEIGITLFENGRATKQARTNPIMSRQEDQTKYGAGKKWLTKKR
jgi:hypothetical protein